MDIFHLTREIEASDMSSLEAVMNCDEERLKLEEEAERLIGQVGKNDWPRFYSLNSTRGSLVIYHQSSLISRFLFHLFRTMVVEKLSNEFTNA